eukprot:3047426-Rhodomonas_salina.1
MAWCYAPGTQAGGHSGARRAERYQVPRTLPPSATAYNTTVDNTTAYNTTAYNSTAYTTAAYNSTAYTTTAYTIPYRYC